MSDRNHTTRDQLAEVLYSVLVDHHAWIGDDGQPLDYSPEREARIGDLIHDLADALLASDAIAAVRAAAVAETTAAIEGIGEFDAWLTVAPGVRVRVMHAHDVRAALSGGRTALDTTLAQAWDFGYACGLGDYGKSDDETHNANPWRVK